jgi:hypothetical protein
VKDSTCSTQTLISKGLRIGEARNEKQQGGEDQATPRQQAGSGSVHPLMIFKQKRSARDQETDFTETK